MFDVFSPCLILIMNVRSLVFNCDYYNMLKSWTPAVYNCDSNDLYIHICVGRVSIYRTCKSYPQINQFDNGIRITMYSNVKSM